MEPQINFISLAIATFIPMIVGFIYYHPVLFGKFWMAANNFTKESLGSGPKPLQFVAVLITSFMLAFFMWGWVTGGGGMDQFQVTDPTDGHSHVTFGHGVFHGIAISLLVVFPILSSGAVFEKKKSDLGMGQYFVLDDNNFAYGWDSECLEVKDFYTISKATIGLKFFTTPVYPTLIWFMVKFRSFY